MKKASFLLLALIAMFGLVSCQFISSLLGGGDDNAGTVDYSTWWVKGSWDSWAGGDDGSAAPSDGSRHLLAIDSANPKLLTYTITGLRKTDYQFVLCSATEVFQATAAEKTLTTGNQITVSLKNEPTTANMVFSALATSYVVTVDITTPTAPKVKIVAGSTVSTAYTFDELAGAMKVAGSAFAVGWTETAAATADINATAKTVTYHLPLVDGTKAASKNGEFYFHSTLDGYLKTADVTSPTSSGSSATEVEMRSDASSNGKLLDGDAKSDGVYTMVIAIDPDKAVNSGRYMMTLTLTTAGTVDWKYDVPAAVWFKGSFTTPNWGDSTDTATVTNNVASKDFTFATAGTAMFKVAKTQGGWDYGINEVNTTGSSVTISGSGNIEFAAEAGKTYTITVDFSSTTYPVDNKPTVTVALKP